MISFDKLVTYCKERNISLYHLPIGKQTLLNMRSGKKSVTTDTINAICNYLNCDISDIMRYIPDQEEPDQ